MSSVCILVDIHAFCDFDESTKDELIVNPSLDAFLKNLNKDIPIVFLVSAASFCSEGEDLYIYRNEQDKTDRIKLSPLLTKDNILCYEKYSNKKQTIKNIEKAVKDLDDNFIFLSTDHELVKLAKQNDWSAKKIYWEGELHPKSKKEVIDKLSELKSSATLPEICQVYDMDGTMVLEKKSHIKKIAVLNNNLIDWINYLKNDFAIKKWITRVLSARKDPLEKLRISYESYVTSTTELQLELQKMQFTYNSDDVKKTLNEIIAKLQASSDLKSHIKFFETLLQNFTVKNHYLETFTILEQFQKRTSLEFSLEKECFTHGREAKKFFLEKLIRKNPKWLYIFYENDLINILDAQELAAEVKKELGVDLLVIQLMNGDHFVDSLEKITQSYLSDVDSGDEADDDESDVEQELSYFVSYDEIPNDTEEFNLKDDLTEECSSVTKQKTNKRRKIGDISYLVSSMEAGVFSQDSATEEEPTEAPTISKMNN